jgi:hypothetical protein
LEIHAPEKPILTIKEATVHLLIVTVGILIALSLEGIVEYMHHRSVVREARQVLREEIGANRNELEETLTHLKVQQADMRKAIDLLNAQMRGDKAANPETAIEALNYRLAKLHSAGHSSAELMGAFGFMDYKDVSAYAAVYDAQARFEQMQSGAFLAGGGAFSFALRRDLKDMTQSQREMLADKVRDAFGMLIGEAQLGDALDKEYAKLLGGK